MNDEQIDQLLRRTERGIGLRTLSLPSVGWSAVVLSAATFLWAQEVFLSVLFGGLLVLPAIAVSLEASQLWKDYKRTPALRQWREITDNPRVFPAPSTETFELKMALRSLYQSDPQGEVLPLKQALRLLFIYDLQHQRRHTILHRATQLQVVKEQLADKAERLRELGDFNPSLLAGVDEMKEEIEALDKLGDDILASCHRLEAIVLSVQRAVQVKQLHREIADLKSSLSPGRKDPSQLASPEITDIERQIGREIETFLKLQKETDERLREI